MNSVETHTTETLVEKQSKFIAHLLPYTQYEKVLLELKQEHPKARHFVTAFRYINEFDQVVEGSSDDGEPKGTSGKPTLAVLQGQDLINIGVITVRYFGGTKLGTGGLVRAYSDATNKVVENATLVPYEKHEQKRVSCLYSDVGKVEYALEQCRVGVESKSYEAMGVCFSLSATQERIEQFLGEMDRLIKIEE